MSQAEFVGELVDALAQGGARRAIVSPGYRSAPLALALEAHRGIGVRVVVDERAAAFHALGLARASGEPVILACTSGSAAANYLPAVVEAHRARIPLILLTADRPPELQRAGAPQTMPQRHLFADFVVWADELAEAPSLDADLARPPWGARIAQALWAACGEAGGPVHLNLPLRKPLFPEAAPPPRAALPRLHRGRRGLDPASAAAIAGRFAAAERPVIVAGPMIRDLAEETGAAIAALAERSGWPLIADVLAPCRAAGIQRGDAIARRADPGERADAILWFGDAPVSAALLRWIGGSTGPVIQVLEGGEWRDPSFRVSDVVAGDPAAVAAALSLPPADEAWRARWRGAEAAADAALAGAGAAGRWEGPIIDLAMRTWPGQHVHVANSTAIRDVDAFARLRPGARVLCNRGVNGIDGTLASAAGEAAALGRPLLAIVGDLALAHDVGALIHAADPRLVVLVIDNGGGQIFRQLPIREHPAFDPLFETHTPIEIAALAAAAGFAHVRADDDAALVAALRAAHERGRTIVEVKIDPRAAAAARDAFWRSWT